ncbi:DUF308 domain-containing protein [Caulobacter sp. 1776]|uniref:DUF308 domain-containing protein n=1 Tax=Caulobacter sp. 1776 TaxID=3156420 RepID=UPI003398CD01
MADIDDATRQGLKRYYLLRAGVSAAWIVAAVTLGAANPLAGGLLLVAYPAWDALANALDARANGGFAANPPQTLNLVISLAVAAAVVFALQTDPRRVLTVFGVWAGFAGLLQLAAGVRRWRGLGAQWPMVLSGAQSALAGGVFVTQSLGAGPHQPTILIIAPYAGFGAVYFLAAGVALALKARKRAA